MQTLLVATANRGKISEIRDALEGLDLALRSLDDYSITLPPETGDTYAANAIRKAMHAARASGLLSLGDDSGLEVRALGGAPGLHSARFGGDLSTPRRNALLLQRLAGYSDRHARMVCTLALAWPQGPIELFTGECEGLIASAPRGQRGFGYDPLFLVPELGRTFSELTLAEKRATSHRGRALAALRQRLERLTGQDAPGGR